MHGKKQQLEPDKKQWIGFKLGKEALYYHLAYLTYMQSTSCEMLGLDEAQPRIKIAGRNTNNIKYADDTTLWHKGKKN